MSQITNLKSTSERLQIRLNGIKSAIGHQHAYLCTLTADLESNEYNEAWAELNHLNCRYEKVYAELQEAERQLEAATAPAIYVHNTTPPPAKPVPTAEELPARNVARVQEASQQPETAGLKDELLQKVIQLPKAYLVADIEERYGRRDITIHETPIRAVEKFAELNLSGYRMSALGKDKVKELRDDHQLEYISDLGQRKAEVKTVVAVADVQRLIKRLFEQNTQTTSAGPENKVKRNRKKKKPALANR